MSTNISERISWADFEKVLIVAGTVVRVEPFPEARSPAYKVWVDFGPYGEKKTSARITEFYKPDELVGRQIVGVINFPDKQVGPFRSEFLLTGFPTDDGRHRHRDRAAGAERHAARLIVGEGIRFIVIPAKAGIQLLMPRAWIPACAE